MSSWNFTSYRRIEAGQMAWRRRARCRDGDPDAMFVPGAEQNIAKRVCQPCPVRYECLVFALDNRIEFGVYGGKTERERRQLLKRHPSTRWRDLYRSLGVIR